MGTPQRKFQKKVGWGEALYLEVHLHSPQKLRQVVEDVIWPVVGQMVGSRNTFAKLCDLDEAPEGPHKWRAWLLLTALGQDPGAWGISDDAVPSGFPSVDHLREQLVARETGSPRRGSTGSGWLRGTGVHPGRGVVAA